MQLAYTLDKSDFLNHQLYLASKSERIKKNRLKSRLWATSMSLSVASICYVNQQLGLVYWFLLLAVLTFIFFPFYSRRMHVNHYQKFIDENYKSKMGKEVLLQLERDRIESKDEYSEGTLKLTAFSEIAEVPTAIYLRLEGSSLILPKARLNNIEEVKSTLQKVAADHNIPYLEDLAWRWK